MTQSHPRVNADHKLSSAFGMAHPYPLSLRLTTVAPHFPFPLVQQPLRASALAQSRLSVGTQDGIGGQQFFF